MHIQILPFLSRFHGKDVTRYAIVLISPALPRPYYWNVTGEASGRWSQDSLDAELYDSRKEAELQILYYTSAVPEIFTVKGLIYETEDST